MCRRLASRAVRGAALLVGSAALAPSVAGAHGIQAQAEVPVPLLAFYWAAGAVLLVSFIALGVGWRRPVLAEAVARSSSIDSAPHRRGLQAGAWILGALGFALLVLVLATAAFGSTDLNDNPAPIAIFVVWWILAPVLAALGPDLWRIAHPVAWFARLVGIPAHREGWPLGRGVWPAFVALSVFIWLELVYPTAADVRLLALLVAAWIAITLAAMWSYGVEVWLQAGEPFTVYTGVLHHLSPVHAGRSESGELRVVSRPPVAGLSAMRVPPGMVALICLLIGSVSYDGLSRTEWWRSRVATGSARLTERGVAAEDAQILFGSFGLVAMVLLAIASFVAAARVARWAGRLPVRTTWGTTAQAFAPSLVPIALAYVVAHYVSYVWYQSQRLIPLASDPFGTGADLFGTADHGVDYTTLSANAVWGVQIGAIVIGHVLGLVLAHDRALQIEAAHSGVRAVRSQVPMLGLMVLFTIGGLYFLSEGLNA